MKSQKAALIEIGGSHDECLYSQLLFLKSGGYHTTLICGESLRGQVEAFDAANEKLFYEFNNINSFQKRKLIGAIARHIKRNGIETIILNTAQSSLARSLALRLPTGVKILGTLHNLQKLNTSFTQRLISLRIKKYFLLNDYLIDNLSLVPSKELQFNSYYPIFFPEFGNITVEKPENETWILVPGQVEYKRRDYKTLVDTFSKLEPKPNYKFILLGKSTHAAGNGNELRNLLTEKGVSNHFIMWDDFVDNKTFHSYLKACDVVMPLIHPGNEGFEQYLHYQVSGAFNLAFAYRKPLLMLHEFNTYADFKENSIFYTFPTLENVLLKLPELIEKEKSQFYQNSKWRFDNQASKYLAFIKD